MTERIHLNDELDIQMIPLAQLDQAVEHRLPGSIARKIVVRNEKPVDSLLIILTDDGFQIIGTAKPALAALHIDNRAERTLIGTTASQIKTGVRSRSTTDVARG